MLAGWLRCLCNHTRRAKPFSTLLPMSTRRCSLTGARISALTLLHALAAKANGMMKRCGFCGLQSKIEIPSRPKPTMQQGLTALCNAGRPGGKQVFLFTRA